MIIHVCTIMKYKLPFDHHFLLNGLSPKHWTQAVDWLTMLDCPLKQWEKHSHHEKTVPIHLLSCPGTPW